jgi:CheY-like chemotaxis protein/HAMP domain-containing protein
MDPEQSIGIENPGGRTPFFRGLRGTLLGWFVLLALVPMALVSVLSYDRAQKALTQSVSEKLVSTREDNKNIILTLFKRWNSDILFVSQMESLKSDIVDLSAGFNFIGPDRIKSLYSAKSDLMDAEDGSAYSAVHQEEHSFFKIYKDIQSYEDVLLIDLAGNVVYTEQKGPVFTVSLISGSSYKKTNLAKLYQGLKTARPGEVLIEDAALFENDAAMFMGTPIYREKFCLGYLVFQLPLKSISKRMALRKGMGLTGEIYLVGQDLRMRSNSINDPVNRTIKASLSGTIEQNGVDSKAVRDALAGESDVCIITDYRGKKVLSAHAPLAINGLEWVILSEVDIEEAMAPAISLAKIIAGLAVAIAFIVLALSLLVSGRIASPIRSLTDWARKFTGGDLTLMEIKTPKNEIGILNESFKDAVTSMRAARSEEERRNWQNTGLSKLDDQMRGVQDLDVLCRNIVTFIATYLQAQVGAFFLNNGDGVFNLKASYAYKTRKTLSNVFKKGEGLIGQAALEKQSILLTNVPDDYVAISSGLGEKKPRNILVVPIVFNEVTLGVMELGTFKDFSEDQRTFLEENAERISIALDSATAQQKLQKTLEVSQQQAEELQAQQEELQAANEEMEEQTQQLTASEGKLKEQQEELQAANEELEEKTQYLEGNKKNIEEKNKALETLGKDLEKKAEDLAMASKYKSEFLANMSHELRTPLNSLLLLARLLADNKEKNLLADQVESARIIYNSGNDLLALINEILDLSKIEAGQMQLSLAETPLTDLSQALDTNFRTLIHQKGLSLDISITEDAPKIIVSDQQRIIQILKNFIANACKFTSTGGIRVAFSRPDKLVAFSQEELARQETIAIAVQDTGIGIAEDKQKIIFQAFQQVEGGSARKYGGTGLGLSISRELATLLGGEIQLKSVLNEGSTFTLILPVKATACEPMSMPKPSGYKQPEIPAKKMVMKNDSREPLPPAIVDDRKQIAAEDKVILIIEDDVEFAATLMKICRQKGFKVLVSITGEDGLKLAESFTINAIILDIHLPGMDGWAVLESLKENSSTRHIPVHFMSADDPVPEAFSKGAVGYLTKPITLEGIEKAIVNLNAMINKKMKDLLLVEDDSNQRYVINKLIRDNDVAIQEVSTGEEALAVLQTKQFDCMILDLGLPDMSGFDLLKKMKKNPLITLPPVVVYTGRELTPEEERELRRYADSIIIKGVRSEERLLDETSLFLHRVIDEMPEDKRKMISILHDPDQALQNRTILIVDDDMRNVFALSKVLNDKGANTIKAENGIKALEILSKRKDVDLVLMDIMMPVMDGYETMKKIRSESRFSRLPIIALTAKAMQQDKEDCIAAGANDYLSKPVKIDRLLSMMRVWLYR